MSDPEFAGCRDVVIEGTVEAECMQWLWEDGWCRPKSVTLFLNSSGGYCNWVPNVRARLSTLRTRCIIHYAGSAAAFLALACEDRFILSNSSLDLHLPTTLIEGHRFLLRTRKQVIKNYEELLYRLITILEQDYPLFAKSPEMDELLQIGECSITPQRALELDLVTGVIEAKTARPSPRFGHDW